MAPSPKFPRLLSPAEAEVIAEAEAITVEAAAADEITTTYRVRVEQPR